MALLSWWYFLAVTLLYCPLVDSSRILLYPYGHCLNSHLLNMERLGSVLLQGGHEVSFLVSDTYKGPYSNVNLTGMRVLRYRAPANASVICDYKSLDSFLQTPMSALIHSFYRSTLDYCDALLQDRAMLEQLREARFDLAVYDAVDQCSKVLAGYLDVLFIVFHTHGLDTVMPRNPAYLPAMITAFSDEMSLAQRVLNTAAYAMQRVIAYVAISFYEDLRLNHKLATEVGLSDVFAKASLRFVLGDFGLDYVGPLHPTTILIGGVIEGSTDTLDPELKAFLDGGRHQGVVLFSFGSLMRTYDEHWQRLFFRALHQLPFRVLWKFQGPVLHEVPPNVRLSAWIPQQAVLAHPSVRVFVTHCGWNSAYETAYHGVPVVAIPLFGDQFFQATKITHRAKLGEQLDIRRMTASVLRDTIIRVAGDPHYRANSRYVSSMMRTRRRSQREDILYWVDFVTRLNGTNYLRSKESNLSWYQLLLLDVCFIFGTTFLLLVVSIRWFCRRTLPLITDRQRRKTKED